MRIVIAELYNNNDPWCAVESRITHSIRVAATKNVQEPIWHVVNLDTVSFIKGQFHEECNKIC